MERFNPTKLGRVFLHPLMVLIGSVKYPEHICANHLYVVRCCCKDVCLMRALEVRVTRLWLSRLRRHIYSYRLCAKGSSCMSVCVCVCVGGCMCKAPSLEGCDTASPSHRAKDGIVTIQLQSVLYRVSVSAKKPPVLSKYIQSVG